MARGPETLRKREIFILLTIGPPHSNRVSTEGDRVSRPAGVQRRKSRPQSVPREAHAGPPGPGPTHDRSARVEGRLAGNPLLPHFAEA